MALIKAKILGVPHLTEGKNETFIEAEDVGGLLNKIKNQYPRLRKEVFNERTGELDKRFLILVNGKALVTLADKLSPEDEVEILPVIAGGR